MHHKARCSAKKAKATRVKAQYRKDEEWDVSENEEADFLRIEFFFECAPSFRFSSLNCTYVPL